MGRSEISTVGLLRWAHEQSAADEVVGMFWAKLCEAVRQPASASPAKVLNELRLYAGNSIANFFREDGIAYEEAAYEVAEVLRPWFGDAEYEADDLDACESFVLKRMEVKENDIQKLCDAIRDKGTDTAENIQGRKILRTVAIEVGGAVAAKQIAKVAAAKAAQRVAAEAGKQVAKKAAVKAAQQVAREVAKQLAARIIAGVNIILIGWTVISIAGPARRVTIPAVTYIALLRRIYRGTAQGL